MCLPPLCCRFVGQYLTRAEAKLGKLVDAGCVVSQPCPHVSHAACRPGTSDDNPDLVVSKGLCETLLQLVSSTCCIMLQLPAYSCFES